MQDKHSRCPLLFPWPRHFFILELPLPESRGPMQLHWLQRLKAGLEYNVCMNETISFHLRVVFGYVTWIFCQRF